MLSSAANQVSVWLRQKAVKFDSKCADWCTLWEKAYGLALHYELIHPGGLLFVDQCLQ